MFGACIFMTANKLEIRCGWAQPYKIIAKLIVHSIFIRFGSKLYRHIVGFPMATKCALFAADSFLFCYEIEFMVSF